MSSSALSGSPTSFYADTQDMSSESRGSGSSWAGELQGLMSKIKAEEALQFQDANLDNYTDDAPYILPTMKEIFEHHANRGRYQRAWSLFDSSRDSTDFRNPFLEDSYSKDQGSYFQGRRWHTAEHVGVHDDEQTLQDTFSRPSRWDTSKYVGVDDDEQTLHDTFSKAGGRNTPECCMGSDSEPPNSLSSSSNPNCPRLSSTPSDFTVSDNEDHFEYFSQIFDSHLDNFLQDLLTQGFNDAAIEALSKLDVEALVEDSKSNGYRFFDRDEEKRRLRLFPHQDLSPHPPMVGCHCHHCDTSRYKDANMQAHDPSVWCSCIHCRHTRNLTLFCYCELCSSISIRKRAREIEQRRYKVELPLQSPSYTQNYYVGATGQKRERSPKRNMFQWIKAHLRARRDSDSDIDDEDTYHLLP